jgi:isocitrate/isopropylmalate dehydrogenase
LWEEALPVSLPTETGLWTHARIIGLASAYALRRAGHDVLVLEKSNGKYRVSSLFYECHLNVDSEEESRRSPVRPKHTFMYEMAGKPINQQEPSKYDQNSQSMGS